MDCDPSKPILTLIEPTIELKDAFLEAEREGGKSARYIDHINELEKNFSDYLERCQRVPEGIVTAPDGSTFQDFKDYIYWVVETGDGKDSRFIGTLILRPKANGWMKEEGGHVGYGVRASLRGQGYGTRILALAKERLRDMFGLREVVVLCAPDNDASRRVIEKNAGRFDKETQNIGSAHLLHRYVIAL